MKDCGKMEIDSLLKKFFDLNRKLSFDTFDVHKDENQKSILQEIELVQSQIMGYWKQLEEDKSKLEKKFTERMKEMDRLLHFNSAVLRNAGQAIISTNKEGIILSFNSAAEEMLGYKAEEVVGKFTPVLFHDPDELREKALELELLSGHDVQPDFEVFSTILELLPTDSNEWNYWRKDGTMIRVRLSISFFEDKDGGIGGYIGIAMDVTLEKQMIEALRSSEELFRKMFINHGAIMLLVDPTTKKIVEANLSATKFYGYNFNSGEILITDVNVLPQEMVQREIEDAVSERKNYFVLPHKLVSGEIRTVEVHISPIEFMGRSLLFSIVHDITDRREAEEALVKSERTLIQVTDNVPVFISLVNTELRYVFANSTYEKFFGFDKDEIVGKHIKEVIGDTSFKKAEEYLVRALKGETVTFDNFLSNRNGEKIFFNTAFAPQYHNAQITGLVITAMNLSEKERAETFIKVQRELAHRLSNTSNLIEAADASLDCILTLKEIDGGGIYFLDAPSGKFTLTSHKGLSDRFINRINKFQPSAHQVQMIFSGQPHYGLYDELIPIKSTAEERDNILGLAVVPIQNKGKVLGCLNLASRTVGNFDQNLRNQIETMAVQMSCVIARIMVEQELLSSKQNFK